MTKTTPLPRVWPFLALAFALTQLAGCALIQDDPGQVPLVYSARNFLIPF